MAPGPCTLQRLLCLFLLSLLCLRQHCLFGDGLEMVSLSEGISQLTEACGLLTLHSHWV